MASIQLLLPEPGPFSAGITSGNRASAARWGELWSELGFEIQVAEGATDAFGPNPVVCVALHAVKSAELLEIFAEDFPDVPRVVVLGGTEISAAGELDARARKTLQAAQAIVTLNGATAMRLEDDFGATLRMIRQSAKPVPRQAPDPTRFELLFPAHLRPVKDPLVLPKALDLLPPESRVYVLHAGATIDEEIGEPFHAAARRSERFESRGALPRPDVLQQLSRARGLINTSLVEGASGAITDALASGVPIIASDAEANVDLLGPDWPLLFPCGDAQALADRCRSLESDRDLGPELQRRLRTLGPKISSEAELDGWRRLFRELGL